MQPLSYVWHFHINGDIDLKRGFIVKMSASDAHVSEYSPDGKLFANIDVQGILRIFDTDTSELKQEYTPNLHLSGPCSALLWIVTFTSVERKSKKARTSLNGAGALYIALGTTKGLVSLYSYAEAKVERCLKGDGHAGRITALEQGDLGKLFSCGEDCKVIEWSLTSEKQLLSWSVGPEKPSSLAYMSASKSLVVGSRQIKVFSVETRELLQTFTGHTSEVNLMRKFVFEENKEYAVTASRMERITCLWEIGGQGKNCPPFCALLMEDVAYCLTCQMDEESNALQIASVTRSGVIHIYLIEIKSVRAEKPIKPKLTISVASDSTTVIEPISVIAATFQHSQRPNEILFNYGDRHFMLFEHLKPNFGEKMQVLIRTKPRNLIKQISGTKAKGTDAALKILNPIIDDRQVDHKSSVTLGKRNKKSADLSLESRLQNLNLDIRENKTAPQAECKVHLLLQSLHSKDAVLLRSVLCTNDVKTIQLTVQKLPTRYIGTLIDELTLLMHQKHVNVEFAMNWLKILAQTHSSQLMALGAEELLNKFGPCIGIIEHRTNCLKELSKLNGRLQLLVNQLKRDTDTEPNDFHSENLLVYEDDGKYELINLMWIECNLMLCLKTHQILKWKMLEERVIPTTRGKRIMLKKIKEQWIKITMTMRTWKCELSTEFPPSLSSTPNVNGVICRTTIELVGRLPGNTLCVLPPNVCYQYWIQNGNASVTMSGPKSEPPMPMLTTSVMDLLVQPVHSPDKTLLVNSFICANSAITLGMTLSQSTNIGVSSRLRKATCKTARFSVVLINSPDIIASRASATRLTFANSRSFPIISSLIKFFE
ncbi:hypothetical protein GQX74_005106 [Glossina fuscipes]|nr:hypothetical protein GQX74_005106 [Glossina fuscipes]